MPRCQTPAHPDCWHECPDGETCLAFYEIETQSCYRGCNGKLLAAGFAAAIARSGWDAVTTAEARGISAEDVGVAAGVIRALADSRRPDARDGRSKLVRNMARHVERRMTLPRWQRLLRPQQPRFDFSWHTAPILEALDVILRAEPRQGIGR